jgi:hemerythrin-like domain-containing protein
MAKNAIELLKADHETVRKLLNEISETTERAAKTRGELLERIASELSVHTRIEEEIFYPAFRDAGEKEESVMVYEAREEHRAVDELVLPDLEKTEVGSMEFSGRVKVLKELIEHHADEEEEEMFPKAEQLLSEAELEELGQRMQARKKELAG